MADWWSWAAWAPAVAALPWARQRWRLSRAKYPSLAGHARLAKTVARLVPGYAYSLETAFDVDGAPADVAQTRRAAFLALGERLRMRSPRTLQATRAARSALPDLQLTGRYRVPFPFADVVAAHLPLGAFWDRSHGVQLVDLDGHTYYDLAGSYGVNLFGPDFYKDCVQEGERMARSLGPVLGGYHACVADNVARLQAISGLEQVSFHMSGTEAVMQAVRLARYHTGRRYVVRFAGAYHGWWEDVQPGPGNPLPPRDTYTLADLSERSLEVLRSRRDIACVLVNPLQALHPNHNAPADSSLVGTRCLQRAERSAYADWLRRLRAVCRERGIAFILDDVFMGFRLARGGSQEYFGVEADMVCYGKTLGGGLPVGVVCGRAEWMQRFRPERPADLCLARGTFNAHPYVMATMNAFLRRLDEPAVAAAYEGLDERWQRWEHEFNAALQAGGFPVRVSALSSVWTLNYLQPSRYHWMLQYYLREAGLALSWVGTGRFIFSLAYRDEDLVEVRTRLLEACARMAADGWWWRDPSVDEAQWRRQQRRRLLGELVRARGWGRAAPPA
ncbi:aminotransferase class III-fold pyridoxal phosphate-dependent enzyme [Tepidimonas charontis]|uniref:Glutamate-1-semialdehyde 2,1-aminomutase n=1 Tax=Tepidimonas charontis TaxID=2267262 RepID=A0A554XGU9_9BURK|nr:aminotransferase class III-fold pyridoxal phosphate-dependent enzyme [Tepidimonas charontis]TSE35042.1 Glutamate-1-semialdehyde 2,1-aminomutase [Tepidimonas charontis]